MSTHKTVAVTYNAILPQLPSSSEENISAAPDSRPSRRPTPPQERTTQGTSHKSLAHENQEKEDLLEEYDQMLNDYTKDEELRNKKNAKLKEQMDNLEKKILKLREANKALEFKLEVEYFLVIQSTFYFIYLCW